MLRLSPNLNNLDHVRGLCSNLVDVSFCFPCCSTVSSFLYFDSTRNCLLAAFNSQVGGRNRELLALHALSDLHVFIHLYCSVCFKVVPRLFTSHPHSYNNGLQTTLRVTQKIFLFFSNVSTINAFVSEIVFYGICTVPAVDLCMGLSDVSLAFLCWLCVIFNQIKLLSPFSP